MPRRVGNERLSRELYRAARIDASCRDRIASAYSRSRAVVRTLRRRAVPACSGRTTVRDLEYTLAILSRQLASMRAAR